MNFLFRLGMWSPWRGRWTTLDQTCQLPIHSYGHLPPGVHERYFSGVSSSIWPEAAEEISHPVFESPVGLESKKYVMP